MDVFGNYCTYTTQKDRDEDLRNIGKYSRPHQLISAVACIGKKSEQLVNEVMDCKNIKLFDESKLVNVLDPNGNPETRITELSPLMIACIMGKLSTVKQLIDYARQRLSPDKFKLFVNIKVVKQMGGNNALLYACSSNSQNETIFQYLITEAEADLNVMNDYNINCLLLATKK